MTKFFFLSFLISLNTFACPLGHDLAQPLSIPVGVSEGGITQEEFMKISGDIEAIYAPEISSRGAKLIMQKAWESSTVNAYAQREKDEWKVILLGGMARHKHMTSDGFALIVCHEIGHHLGGFPLYDGIDIGWASNEGQSDYFSVMKCLRRYWETADNSAAIAGKVIPPKLKNECRDEALCIRTGLAGLSAATLFADLAWFSGKPKFETPDTRVVKVTYGAHPKAQCRLDTYLQSSLCEVSHTEEMTTETMGACHESLGHKIGMRTLCWFKPTL
jgi:hypothetical protein